MAEYIEKEALLGAIDCEFFKTDPDGAEQIGVLKCRRIAHTLPAADVAPVVRCKDCKHNHWELEPCHGKTIHYCNVFGFKIDITDALHEFFCGYGERRDSEC